MAEGVNIPVVVDIEKAFQDAAKRVGVAMKPLKQAIDDKGVLELKFRTTIPEDDLKNFSKEIQATAKKAEEGFVTIERSFEQLWENGKPKLDDLRGALASFKTQLNAKWNNGKIDSPDVESLQKAIILMEDYLYNRNRAVSLTEEQYRKSLQAARAEEQRNFIIQQEANTISEINAKIGALRGNLDNMSLKKNASEWTKTGREIQKATAELAKFEAKYNQVTTKPGSINRLNAEMQALTDKWNAMSKAQKFDRDGNLKASAQRVIDKYKQLTEEVQKYGYSLEDAARKGADELDKTNSKLGSLIKNSIRLIAIHAASRFVRNIREVTAEFELQRVALGSIIRDTERAEELFRQIKAAAIESPFEIKDLVSYTKQLSAYQIETDKLFDTTKKLADISAGLGVDMSRLVLAYGQVRAAAVLRGQELRQFTEAGIPLVDKLAEKFQELRGEMVSTGEVFQLISERAVPFRMIEEIFDDMTSAGGMFYKMQEKQAKTLAGQWANLKDAVSIMYDEMGNTRGVHKAMEGMISMARSIMKNWRAWYKVIKYVGAGLASYYGIAKIAAVQTEKLAVSEASAAAAESLREKNIRKFVTAIIGKTAAEKVSTVATNLHTFAINKANAASNAFIATLWRLTAAMLNNPFGIAAVAIGTLVTLLFSLDNKTKDVAKSIDDAEASITALNKTTGDTQKLIDKYEELSKKQKLTTEQSKELRDVSRELANIFPKTVEGIDKQTGALTLNIEKLKEYNTEAEKALRSGMSAQIKENEKTIKKNQKEIDRMVRENNRGWGRRKNISLLSPMLVPLSNKQLAENKDAIIKLQNENESLAKTNQNLIDTLNGVTKASGNATKKTTEWQDKLIKFNSRLDEKGNALQVISPDQIENYSKLGDALDEIAKKYNEYNEQEKTLRAALKDKTGTEKKELQGILDRTVARKKLAKEELDYYNAFYLTQRKSGRDNSLQSLRGEISDITNAYKKFIELKKYKSEVAALSDIGTFFPGLKGWKPTYTKMIERLEGMLSSYKGNADATRIIEQAIANIKFDEVKRELDEKLSLLTDEIKRSETARNFYNDLLGLTGDEKLSTDLTISVYGSIGEEFKDRIKKQLVDALSSLDAMSFAGLDDSIRDAFDTGDYSYLMKNLEKVPEKLRSVVKQVASDSENFSDRQIRGWLKDLNNFKTYSEKRVKLARETAQKIKEIDESDIPAERKPDLKKEYLRKETEQLAKLEYEAFKDTPMYVEVFANLDAASSRMLRNLRENLLSMKGQWKDGLAPTELRELQKRINELDKQLAARNPFKALINSIREYRQLTSTKSRKEADLAVETANENVKLQKERLTVALADYEIAKKKYGTTSDEAAIAEEALNDQKEATDEAIRQAEAAQNTANRYREVGQQIQYAASELKKWSGYINTSLDGIGQIFKTFSSSDAGETFDILSEGVGKTLSGTADLAAGVGKILSGTDIVGGIVDVVKGAGDFIEGTFGTSNRIKIKRINEQIEEQARLIKELEYSYNRLEKAMAKTFGSDYISNYNQEIATLQAQAEAYRNQAELEEDKGKKKDEDKVREYLNSAREVEDQINDMKSQLSEFFTETDLTSAAKDFAQSWIEAYKEFGSTTDAMKEKFNDMIQNMVVNSLAAQLVQSILRPVFDAIDSASKDGALSAMEIAAISAMVPERMQMIDDSMQSLMNQLTSAGVNLRQQVGGFTGISRDIAGATEESINGLAAGINTQNFYMQHIDANVSAILATLTGGTTTAASGTTGEYVDPYKDTMLLYAQHIPDIHETLNSILSSLNSVIALNGTKKAIQVMM